MSKKETKITKIQRFIGANKPTRRELITFIITGSKKPLLKEVYSRKRGTYSTNISTWLYYGYVVVNPKTKRYELTKLGRKTTHFYRKPLEFTIQQLKQKLSYYMDNNDELSNTNDKLNKTINEMEQSFLDINESLLKVGF